MTNRRYGIRHFWGILNFDDAVLLDIPSAIGRTAKRVFIFDLMSKLRTGRLPQVGFAIFLAVGLWRAPGIAAPITNAVVVDHVELNGHPISMSASRKVDLGPSPRNLVLYMAAVRSNQPPPLRWRARLNGFENTWHQGGGFMYLQVRFFNTVGDVVDQTNLSVSGESPGWTGSIKTSALTHRRETITVPPNATKAQVVISSAGPPATVGIYLVADLVITASADGSVPVVVFKSPFDQSPKSNTVASDPPIGWIRDGSRPMMAKILQLGPDLSVNAFAIEDIDAHAHAEWRSYRLVPDMKPGERLILEWNEMFSVGITDFRYFSYPHLPAGNYQFQILGVDLMGNPDGTESSLAIYVPPPFWKRLWFWGALLAVFTTFVAGGARYAFWQRLRREMARLKAEQALTSERLRIAHDIHDDLGARITQITMVSAMSLNDPALSDKTRAELAQIKHMSRGLVSALYETVWAVNPANDNLDALGSYLCQMASQLCDRTQYHCRLHISELSQELWVSSHVRHNITMAVKEAINNVIKHAHGTEIVMTIQLNQQALDIEIKDNGFGFQPLAAVGGNGLANMRQRMNDIGGNCSIASVPGSGAAVRFQWALKSQIRSDGL